MADTSNNAMTMFSETKLIIPDFVSPLDVNKIYEWFEKYNIAKVENVDFHEHEEEEYYVEDGPSYYGYAIINIKEWYDNTCSRNFYENICNMKCKMVFDDPYYWELEFYDYTLYNNLHSNSCECSHDNEVYYNQAQNLNESNDSCHLLECENKEEEISEEYDSEEYDSGEEVDDENDVDYVYEETDNEEDNYYEYNIYNKIDNKMKTLKKNKPKQNTENDNVTSTFEGSLVSNNKNYMKRNKRKDFKNIWVRRLRQKNNV